MEITPATPECTAPMTKYGAKMVAFQPSTAICTAKSHDTMLCTETKTGRMSAESRKPAMICSFHWRVLPRQPMLMKP